MSPRGTDKRRRFSAAPDRILSAIVLLALVVRLAGIRWGLPDATHYFSYHPDEFETAGRAIRILNTGDWNPEFFNYGSLFLYLTALVAWPFHVAGIVKTVTGTHVVARAISAALGAGTVLVTARIGARLLRKWTAVLAAAFVALAPGHVLHSTFATVDVTATFFVSLALLFTVRAFDSPHRRREFLLAGAAAGLGAGTKYGAGAVLLAPFAAAVLVSGANVVERVRLAGLSVVASAVAFLAAVPYSLIAMDRFQEDVGYELFVHPREGHVDIFRNTGDGWSYHLLENLPYVLGVPLLLMALAGVGVWLARRRPREAVLLAFALPFFVLLGASRVRFLRYTLPLVPVLALAAAALFERLTDATRGKRPAWVLAAVAVATCAVLTRFQLATMLRPDARTEAAEWIAEHVPPGSTIGLPTVPWFTTPPVTPWNGGERSRDHFEHEPSRWRFLLCENWVLAPFDRSRPAAYAMDVFVMSEYDWRDAERLQDPRASVFLAALGRDYELAARFEGMPPLQRKFFGRSFAPHDWLYPFADVQIWRRREGAAANVAQ